MKDEAYQAYKTSSSWAQTQHSARIKRLLSDRRGDLTSNRFIAYFSTNPRNVAFTMADTLQHNRVAESLKCPKVSSFVLFATSVYRHFYHKFYGFLSPSSSRSLSRFKGDTCPSDSVSNESPDLLSTTTVTSASISGTSDSYYATSPTSTSRPRSPSHPLSDNTITTGDTVTPKKSHSRTSRASRAHHHARPTSPHLINDSGIRVGVNERLIAYGPRTPASPVPASALLAQPTSTKEKRRSKPFFGLPMAPWSRSTTMTRPSLYPSIFENPSQPPLQSIKCRKFVQNRCVELQYHSWFYGS